MTRDELLVAYKDGKSDFCGAYLGGANLRGAYLSGANLGEQWIVQGAIRGGTQLGDETLAILDSLWALAFIRGYLDSEGNWIGELT